MPQRLGIFLALGWCFLGQPASVAALTVIRLGGEDLPPPDLEVPYEFVQLPWAEVDPARHGLAELIEIDSAFVEPLRLDPTTNLVPMLEERGGQVLALTWIGWGPASGRDLAMFDGDPTTAFLGDGDWGGDYGVIRQKSLIFDLGGRFFLERIRFFPRERFLADRFVQRFIVGISDGDPLKKGTTFRTMCLKTWSPSSTCPCPPCRCNNCFLKHLRIRAAFGRSPSWRYTVAVLPRSPAMSPT